jgi:hypothetical protein
MRRFALALAPVLFLWVLPGCRARQPFVGKWQTSTGATWEFRPDGDFAETTTLPAMPNARATIFHRWTAEKEVLTIGREGGAGQGSHYRWSFSADENTVTLTSDDPAPPRDAGGIPHSTIVLHKR